MEPIDVRTEIANVLRLAALPQVAMMLDSSVPSIILGADAHHIRLINAAAAAVLGLGLAKDWLGSAAPLDDAIVRHLTRVVPALKPGAQTSERIRYYRGIKPVVVSLKITRLATPDDEMLIRVDMPDLVRPGMEADLEATLKLYAIEDTFLTAFAGERPLAVIGEADILDEAPGEIEAIAARPIEGGCETIVVPTPKGERPVTVIEFGRGHEPEAGEASERRRLLIVGATQARSVVAMPAEDAAATAEAAPIENGVMAVDHTPAAITEHSFTFAPQPKPRRFVWHMDASGRIVSLDASFAEILGSHATPNTGETWQDLTGRLQIEHGERITEALARRVAFHGLSFRWPIEGTDQAAAIEWTGMPGPDGSFSGFGIIRADKPEPDALARGLGLVPPAPLPEPEPEPIALPPAPEADVFGPKTTIEPVAAAAVVVEHVAAHEPPPVADITAGLVADNDAVEHTAPASEEPPILLPPPPAYISPETLRLSGDERNAFRQIAEALGARFEGDDDHLVPQPAVIIPPAPSDSVRVLSTQELLDELNRTHPPSDKPRAAQLGAETSVQVERDARLVDRLPIAVGLTRDEAFIHVNSAFLTLTGYTSLDEINRAGGLDVLFAGPHAAKGWTHERGRHHIPLVTRQGRVVPVDARIASVPWGAGNALLITLVSGDRPTTQPLDDSEPLRAAESTLREQDRRIATLEVIVAQASDGVLMLDTNGRILSANAAAEALFAYPPGQLTGRAFVDLIATADRRSALDYLDGLARNGIGSLLQDGRELTAETASDRRVTLHVVLGRMPEGSEAAYCATLRDVSRWKTSEEELTAARRRAEQASTQKSDFLAKISHEIRTPLNAIIGFSEVMLSERFGAIGVERYKDYLRDIQSSGTHIMSLVNDLLDLSKVEAGKLDLKFDTVHLSEVLAECVNLMQPQANRERIIIRASITQGLPPVVADLRSIRQIVLNLLSNAIKFTPPGGQVIVSASLEDTSEVVVRVRDTGYGMSPSEVETALEPFRQIANGRGRGTGPGAGTGLGLPLTKALVEANRASLKIDSAVNQGTLVQITFPAPLVLAAE